MYRDHFKFFIFKRFYSFEGGRESERERKRAHKHGERQKERESQTPG